MFFCQSKFSFAFKLFFSISIFFLVSPINSVYAVASSTHLNAAVSVADGEKNIKNCKKNMKTKEKGRWKISAHSPVRAGKEPGPLD